MRALQVALLRELGASQRLSLLIEGESLLNDGTAMVLFIVFADAMSGEVRDAGETVAFFARLSFARRSWSSRSFWPFAVAWLLSCSTALASSAAPAVTWK